MPWHPSTSRPKAADAAVPAKKRQDDLTSALLGGDKAARNMLGKLDQVDKKNPKPRISTPGMGAAIGNAGVLLGQLAALDGKDVSATVRVAAKGANLGGIIGQLNQIDRRGKSGGGRVRGFDGGGWTGPGGRLDVAGVVHADEFVLKKSSRQSIERQAPGALDYMNQTGLPVTRGGESAVLVPLLERLIDAVEQRQRISIGGREFMTIVADTNRQIARKG
jgi:hypothetical protein